MSRAFNGARAIAKRAIISALAIPFISRLLSIIDTYDVMTHHRIFRRAASNEEALAEISLQSGKQFDPVLVKAFLEQVDNLAT